jgi:hypothetical protein
VIWHKRWTLGYRGMKSSPRPVVMVLATSGHERLSAASGPDRFTATNERRERPVRQKTEDIIARVV